MRGRIFLGFILFSFSSITGQELRCFQSESKQDKCPKFHYTKKTRKFSIPLEYASQKFPELEGVHIDVRRKKIGTMMAARPRADFIFKKKAKRRYVIYITNDPEMNAGPIFEDMSKCAQVGVLGHELSHILSYRKMNNLQMLWFGVQYLFRKSSIEASTDEMAIRRGFGEQLIEYTRYLYNSPHTNRKYLLMKKKYYLSVNEMERRALSFF